MSILGECIEVGREGDTSLCILRSGRMITCIHLSNLKGCPCVTLLLCRLGRIAVLGKPKFQSSKAIQCRFANAVVDFFKILVNHSQVANYALVQDSMSMTY